METSIEALRRRPPADALQPMPPAVNEVMAACGTRCYSICVLSFSKYYET